MARTIANMATHDEGSTMRRIIFSTLTILILISFVVAVRGEEGDDPTEDNIVAKGNAEKSEFESSPENIDPLIKRGEIERTDIIFRIRAKKERSARDDKDLEALKLLKYKFYPELHLKENNIGVMRDSSATSLPGATYRYQNFRAAEVTILFILDKKNMVVLYAKQRVFVKGYSTKDLEIGRKYVLDALFKFSGQSEYRSEKGLEIVPSITMFEK